MNDARFIGFPFVIIIGKFMKLQNKIELQVRKTNETFLFTLEELIQYLITI